MRLEITLQGICECGRTLEETEKAFESGEVADITIFRPCPCEKEKLEKRIEALMVRHNLTKLQPAKEVIKMSRFHLTDEFITIECCKRAHAAYRKHHRSRPLDDPAHWAVRRHYETLAYGTACIRAALDAKGQTP